MTTFEFGFVVIILPFIVVGIWEYIRERRCAVCRKAVITGTHPACWDKLFPRKGESNG